MSAVDGTTVSVHWTVASADCLAGFRLQWGASGQFLGWFHLRPPQDAVGADGATSRSHYWWLVYEWENLYLACAECRAAQGAKFPVSQTRARVGARDDALDREGPLLIDPCREDPEPSFVYLDSGEMAARDYRGRATIETFDLNRPNLVSRRLAVQVEIAHEVRMLGEALSRSAHDWIAHRLQALYSLASPFAATRRQYINQWVQARPRQIEAVLFDATGGFLTVEELAGDLRRVTNRDKRNASAQFFKPPVGEGPPGVPLKSAPSEVTVAGRTILRAPKKAKEEERWPYLTAAELRRVEIHNFRAIRRLRLDLTGRPGEGAWLMLLGENGSGKTSVLQAIALALAGPGAVERLKLDPKRLLRAGAKEGRIRLVLSGSRRGREVRFGSGVKGLDVRGDRERILVAAYGATRLLPTGSRGRSSDLRVDNLFDPSVSLIHPAVWVPKLSAQEFNAVARALKRLLDLDEKAELRPTHRGIELLEDDLRLPLSELSDGYRAMAALGLDMMQLFLRRWGSLEAAEGIVLIDELGAHLHPRWQMKVTRSLREAFPRVQFIATTHDPLCLRGLRDGEVAVLRRRRNKIYALHRELPPVEGLAVDQLLTSEHFGLHSTMDPEMEAMLDRYYALLARRSRRADENRELDWLSERLDRYRLLGSTLRERLALEVADEFVAAQSTVSSAADYRRLKKQTRERIGEIWQERTQT